MITYHQWDSGIEKDAEIERLKVAYQSSQANVIKYWEQRTSDHKLITELADALAVFHRLGDDGDCNSDCSYYKLIQRAREVVK